METADAPWQCTFWKQAHLTGFIRAGLIGCSESTLCLLLSYILHTYQYSSFPVFSHAIFACNFLLLPIIYLCESSFVNLFLLHFCFPESKYRHPGKMTLVTSSYSTNSKLNNYYVKYYILEIREIRPIKDKIRIRTQI